jgi:hypothetical protein
MASCGYSISWFVEFYQIIFNRINRSLENWYLSKLNEKNYELIRKLISSKLKKAKLHCPCTTKWSSKIQHLFFVIRRSLENWYLSKLNETTVNKSHDDILIEYLKNISTETITSFVEYPQLAIFFFSLRKLIPTKIIESTVIGFTIINDALLRTLYVYMYVLKCAQ